MPLKHKEGPKKTGRKDAKMEGFEMKGVARVDVPKISVFVSAVE